jgi:chromosome segregation ATPase
MKAAISPQIVVQFMDSSITKGIFEESEALDPRSMDSLFKALERENLPGFDYLEFKRALYALKALNLDEATAIRSAFATASTLGLTKDKLLKSAAYYKEVLDNEKKAFDEAMQKQIALKVETKRREVAMIQQKIVEYQATIEKLHAEIAKATEIIQHADEAIQSAQDNIEEVRLKFEKTHELMTRQILDDANDFQQYL